MIVYGWRDGTSVLGAAGEHQCPSCNQTSTFNTVVVYSYFHIWYFLSLVYSKKYFIVCDNCESAMPVDAKATRERFPKDNISIFRKWGLPLVVGLILLFIAWGAISASFADNAKAKATAALVAEPKVGDAYIADLSHVPDSGFTRQSTKGTPAYGLMAIVDIDGDTLSFATSSIGYEKMSSLRQMIKSPSKEFFYVPEMPLDLTKADLKGLLDLKVIIEAERAGPRERDLLRAFEALKTEDAGEDEEADDEETAEV